MQKVLTIAGSDSSGGAGIQADIKTIMAHKCYAMSVITALTAQNTLGVQATLDIDGEFIAKQLDSVFCDIVPESVKLGMLSSATAIEVISQKLQEYSAKNIVLDTVMVSTSGHKLLADNAISALIEKLLPLAKIITPNISEAEVLSGLNIHTKADMECAAKKIATLTDGAVLIKGGHLKDSSDDLLLEKGDFYWLKAGKIDNKNTHGTGCTLSSAIASNLALGHSVLQATLRAKKYVYGAIGAKLNLGVARGPLDHCYNLENKS